LKRIRTPVRKTGARDLDFKERERLYNATAILESNEMLLWHSVARRESVPQTKLHFERVLIAIDSDEESHWSGNTV
jgi:hypothetical protein